MEPDGAVRRAASAADEGWRAERRWSFAHFRNARLLALEPSLTSRIREARGLWKRSPGAVWLPELEEALARAEMALGKVGRIPTAYDAVWRALHDIRHLRCRVGSTHDLIDVANDVRADLQYHPRREALEKEITRLVGVIRTGAFARSEDDARMGLLDLSRQAAEERQSAWRRVNRVIGRRRSAARWLGVVLVLCLLLLPRFLNRHPLPLFMELDPPSSLAELNWPGLRDWLDDVTRLALVALLGAMGGLLSGLSGKEPVNRASTEHHLEQLASRLRPLVGAVSATVLYVLAASGLFNLPGGAAAGAGQAFGAWTVLVSIAAGFSERLLIGQLDRVSSAVAPGSEAAGHAGETGHSAPAARADHTGQQGSAPPRQPPTTPAGAAAHR